MAGMPASMALIRAMRNGCSPRLFGMGSKVDEKTLCTESADKTLKIHNLTHNIHKININTNIINIINNKGIHRACQTSPAGD